MASDGLPRTAIAVIDLFLAGLIFYRGFISPRRRFRSDPALSSMYEYGFSKDGVSWSLREEHGSAPWTVFAQLVETKDAYAVMFPNDRLAMFLPKRVFESPDDQVAFR